MAYDIENKAQQPVTGLRSIGNLDVQLIYKPLFNETNSKMLPAYIIDTSYSDIDTIYFCYNNA